ncbi:predicted protein [Nematostella vectensis]|uniref:Uncharacterized protein n=1 Tax=Nematostella vectensis TaxID=45351 RepID=A7T8G2_NEMVE|nr:predicted protein [Nematostella vectensis]|eukprot:XP_001619825.1 hypothetical protein NEMVEDRAFT_v1g223787 [Nematostella vectensis]
MYPQMVEFEKHPNSDGRDLYMEQAMVCGMMGYSRFLSKNRLKNILSWQNAKGCYGDDESNDDRDVYDISYDKGRIYGRIPQYEEISRRDIKQVASARKLLSMKTMRSLLVEKALEGVLLQTLQDPEVQEHHPWVLHRIKGLAHRVSKLIPEILPFLQKSDRVYYQQVGFVVSKTWSVVRRFRKLSKAPKRHLAFNDKKAGTQAPQPCMEALFGSAGPGSKTCNVTDACWTAMRRPGALGYELTHQALYFMFGEEREGCESHITGVATALISVYLRWVLHSPEMTSRSIAQEAMAYTTSLHHK